MSAHALSAHAGQRPFTTRFVSARDTFELLSDPRLLLLVEFGDRIADTPSDPRSILVGLRQLGASPVAEVWESETPVETGTLGKVAFSMNDHVLVGHMTMDGRDFRSFETATHEAYQTFLPLAAELGFPHYLRLWNYIPDINGPDVDDAGRDMERYKAFCAGRHAAFDAISLAAPELPAASGVGSRSGALLVYFIAAREAGFQVENPRQVSAFHYPPRYGPKSPAFSRAMIKDWGSIKHLYISGTASIVGHASRHRDRAAEQTIESLRNMSALVRNADAEYGVGIRDLSGLTQIKVYVRHTRDLGTIRDCIEGVVSDPHRVLYLAGDLCRADLLVELEGWYTG